MNTATDTTLTADQALSWTIHNAAKELNGYGSKNKALSLIATIAGSATIAQLRERLAEVEQERERWNGPEFGDRRMRHKLGYKVTVLQAAIALRSDVLGF